MNIDEQIEELEIQIALLQEEIKPLEERLQDIYYRKEQQQNHLTYEQENYILENGLEKWRENR